jgi:hypothetical protein
MSFWGHFFGLMGFRFARNWTLSVSTPLNLAPLPRSVLPIPLRVYPLWHLPH